MLLRRFTSPNSENFFVSKALASQVFLLSFIRIIWTSKNLSNLSSIEERVRGAGIVMKHFMNYANIYIPRWTPPLGALITASYRATLAAVSCILLYGCSPQYTQPSPSLHPPCKESYQHCKVVLNSELFFLLKLLSFQWK